ncbi:MAG: NAD(P)-dependent glycerol-3-phosphate dehydrogenase [Magnetococcales bacterium]|nr:NAD(P)-dependent glycerol-3-phosphate dehydrogenase [Magnetococcales bacterium]
MSRPVASFVSPPLPTAVIGAGSWGTALAFVLARKLPAVTLWCREEEVAAGIRNNHRNPLFVSEFLLPENLHATTDLAEVVKNHALLVLVTPTPFLRPTLRRIKPHLHAESCFVAASKGIETGSGALVPQIFAEELGSAWEERLCFLSGPSFARETLAEQPTAVAIASRSLAFAQQIQELFRLPWFRTYRTSDVVGVELGGAVKNVIALAAGIADGLECGQNARAALITRGLAETMRLGMRLGGRPETFAGLSGLGDLVLTATSTLSRNHQVGLRLGQGQSLQEIMAGTREVAEGVPTCQSLNQLAEELGVEMPITRAVYHILFENRSPRSVLEELLGRTPGTEFEES